MATDTEQLLAAEQAVQVLLGELEGLRQQVGAYGQAKQSLEDVRQTLLGSIQTTANLAEQAHAATATLAKIGTPEILARVDAASSKAASLLEAHATQVTGSVAQSTQSVVVALNEMDSRLKGSHNELQASIARQAKRQRSLLLAAVSLSGLALVGAVVCILLLVRPS